MVRSRIIPGPDSSLGSTPAPISASVISAPTRVLPVTNVITQPAELRELLGYPRVKTYSIAPSVAPTFPFPGTGLIGWWDASDLSSITSSAGVVTQLNDKSGNGYHLTPVGTGPTTGTRALNGVNVLDYNGSQSLRNLAFSFAGMNTATVYVVYQRDVNLVDRVLAMTQGATYVDYNDTNGVSWLAVNAGGTYYANALVVNIPNDTAPHLTVIQRNGTTWTGRQDGSTLTGSAASPTANFAATSVGVGSDTAGTSNLDGFVAEIIMCNAVHSTIERQATEAYLQAKWFPTPFDVLSLPGLVGWYDPSDLTTVSAVRYSNQYVTENTTSSSLTSTPTTPIQHGLWLAIAQGWENFNSTPTFTLTDAATDGGPAYVTDETVTNPGVQGFTVVGHRQFGAGSTGNGVYTTFTNTGSGGNPNDVNVLTVLEISGENSTTPIAQHNQAKGSGSSLTVSLPNPPQKNSWVVASILSVGGGAPTTPVGLSSVASSQTYNGDGYGVFYQRGAGPQSVTFTGLPTTTAGYVHEAVIIEVSSAPGVQYATLLLDKSPNGFHLPSDDTGPQIGIRTLGGLNVLDTTTGTLRGRFVMPTNTMSAYVVAQLDSGNRFISMVNATDQDWNSAATVAFVDRNDDGTYYNGGQAIGPAGYGTTPFQYTAIRNGANWVGRKNGVVAVSYPTVTNNFDLQYLGLGGLPSSTAMAFGAAGGVGELIICNVAHSPAVEAQVEAYLQAKWGIPVLGAAPAGWWDAADTGTIS